MFPKVAMMYIGMTAEVDIGITFSNGDPSKGMPPKTIIITNYFFMHIEIVLCFFHLVYTWPNGNITFIGCQDHFVSVVITQACFCKVY